MMTELQAINNLKRALRNSKAIHHGIGAGTLVSAVFFLLHYAGPYWPQRPGMIAIYLIAIAVGVAIGIIYSNIAFKTFEKNAVIQNAALNVRVRLGIKHDFKASGVLILVWIFLLYFYWTWYRPGGKLADTVERVSRTTR